MPTLTCMNGVGAVRRWWSQVPARDAVLALIITAALLYGSYGEAHPSTTAYFNGGHHLPHTPTAALILVAVACLALIWRRRWPVAVLGVSVAAARSIPCSATSTARYWWRR